MSIPRRNRGAAEIGWISTSDIFILASCFFLIVATAAIRDRRSKSELVTKLTVEAKNSSEKLKVFESQFDAIKSREKVLNGQIEAVGKERAQIQAAMEQNSVSQNARAELMAKAQEVTANLQARLSEFQLREQRLMNEISSLTEERDLIQEEKSASSVALEQQRLNNELLGLGGDLRHVVIMVDISRSMKNGSGTSAGASYWNQTKAIIRRWIYNLNVGSAALIFFGDSAELVLEMKELDAVRRQRILDILEQTDPSAKTTNFLDAFQKAYAVPTIDTIIVFSDGLPSVDTNGKAMPGPGKKLPGETDAEFSTRRDSIVQANVKRVLDVHAAIIRLSSQNPTIAINAIGLGNKVYTPQTGNLLNDLALRNRGVFIAIPAK